MSFFIIEVAAGISIALLSALVLFLYKLPRTLEKINEHLKKNEGLISIHGRRLDVHDVLWSAHFKRSVNSEMIAKGEMKFPHGVEQSE